MTTSDATAAVLRDADTLADWIAAECSGSKRCDELLKINEATPEDFRGMPVALLMVLAFDKGQPNGVRVAAIDAIGEFYLTQPGTRAYAARIQTEIEKQRAEDERKDLEEQAAQFRRVTGYSQAAWPSA